MFEEVTLETIEKSVIENGSKFFETLKTTKSFVSRFDRRLGDIERISVKMEGDLNEKYFGIKKCFKSEFDPYADYQDNSHSVCLYLTKDVENLLLSIAKEILPNHKEDFKVSHLYSSSCDRDSCGIILENKVGRVVETVFIQATGIYDYGPSHKFSIYVGKEKK